MPYSSLLVVQPQLHGADIFRGMHVVKWRAKKTFKSNHEADTTVRLQGLQCWHKPHTANGGQNTAGTCLSVVQGTHVSACRFKDSMTMIGRHDFLNVQYLGDTDSE